MPKLSHVKTLESIASKGHDHTKVFRSFVQLAACALLRYPGAPKSLREDEYLEEIGRWDKLCQGLFAQAFGELVSDMEENEPFTDLLGDTYLDWGAKSSRDARGEFYTPKSVSLMTAKMTMPKSPEEFFRDRPVTLLEPACGAGSMILAAAQCVHEVGVSVRCLRVQGWDISPTAIDMCLINTTLWAIPFEGILGNPLSMEVRKYWRNHWFFLAHGCVGGREWVEDDSNPEPDPTEAPKPPSRAVVLQDSLFGDLL